MHFRSNDLVQATFPDDPIIIAIDGPAASGKGTLARNLAKRFHLRHLDTGALYRGLAHLVLKTKKSPDNPDDVQGILPLFLRQLTPTALENPALREDQVGSAASKVAAMPAVRAALLDYQQNFHTTCTAKDNGVVLDGRDVGTVVYPNANIKIFITATPKVRADRRYAELCERGFKDTTDYDTLLQDIIARDHRDRTREIAPMLAAKDAYTVDTSALTASDVLDQAVRIIRSQYATEQS